MFKNSEGYLDLTAGVAMSRVMKEYKQRQRRYFAAKNRKKVYVVSKYAGDVATNTENAIRYCRYVIGQGNMPVASHLLYPQILNDKSPHEREMGLMFGLALLALCDEVWVFTANGEISSGMKREIEEATSLGIPVQQPDMGEC